MHELATQAESVTAHEDEVIKQGLMGTASGQELAIEQAYARFAKPLAAFIREKVAPTLDSDEIATAVSETFCAVARYTAGGGFSPKGALSTLFFSIAKRKATDLLRKKTCQKRRAPKAGDDLDDSESSEYGAESAGEESETRIAQRLELAPDIKKLWAAAEHLYAKEIFREFRLWTGTQPSLQRKVAELILANFGGSSDAEMSRKLAANGVKATPASVKSARRQLVLKFKTLLTEKGIHDEASR
jgi:DNA-directed RNA polymerase specialized sigma24 family protein